MLGVDVRLSRFPSRSKRPVIMTSSEYRTAVVTDADLDWPVAKAFLGVRIASLGGVAGKPDKRVACSDELGSVEIDPAQADVEELHTGIGILASPCHFVRTHHTQSPALLTGRGRVTCDHHGASRARAIA